jgi:hypothetical protein
LQDWRPSAVAAVLQRSLAAQEAQRRGILSLYYGKRLAAAQIAAQMGVPEPAVVGTLQSFRDDLCQNLEGHPALMTPYDPDEQRAWQAFLEDCLWWCFSDAGQEGKGAESDEYLQLIQRHFSPAADLVCPRSWD